MTRAYSRSFPPLEESVLALSIGVPVLEALLGFVLMTVLRYGSSCTFTGCPLVPSS